MSFIDDSSDLMITPKHTGNDTSDGKGYHFNRGGGVAGYQVGNPAPPAEPQRETGPSFRVVEGAVRATPNPDGTIAQESLAHSNGLPAEDTNGLSGVFATARRQGMGGKVQSWSELTDGTLVEVEGVQMTLHHASKLGIVKKLVSGQYAPLGTVDPSLHPLEQPEQKREGYKEPSKSEEESPTVDYYSKEFRGALQQLDELTQNPTATDSMITVGLTHAIDGDIDRAAAAVVSRTGVDPDKGKAVVMHMVEEATKAAASHVKQTYGVDGRAVFEYAAQTLPKDRRISLAQRVYLGDRGAFKEPVDHFNRGQLSKSLGINKS